MSDVQSAGAHFMSGFPALIEAAYLRHSRGAE
jgi:hypothetical protein